PNQTLNPGASYSGSFTTTLPVALPDQYHVIVRTDIFDDIFEGTNNNNNATSSGSTISLTVPTLTLGITADDHLSTGGELLYQIVVPGGKTLEIDLSGEDGAANELYVRFQG